MHSINGNYYCYCKNGVSAGCSHLVLPRILKSAMPITCTSGKKCSHGLSRRYSLPSGVSLWEKGGGALHKGSVLSGLDLELRKRASTPLFLFPPLSAAASAMGPRQVSDHIVARLRHIHEERLGHASSFQTLPGRAQTAGAQEWRAQSPLETLHFFNSLIQRTKGNSCR